jgi:hypothetical protein
MTLECLTSTGKAALKMMQLIGACCLMNTATAQVGPNLKTERYEVLEDVEHSRPAASLLLSRQTIFAVDFQLPIYQLTHLPNSGELMLLQCFLELLVVGFYLTGIADSKLVQGAGSFHRLA